MVDSAPPPQYLPSYTYVRDIHSCLNVAHTQIRNTNQWSEHLQGRNLLVDVNEDGAILIQNLKKSEGNIWTNHLDQEVSRIDSYTKAKVRSPISGDKDGIQGFLTYVY
jgi:hypothetical protein